MKQKELYELKSQHIWQHYDLNEVIALLREYWLNFRHWNDIKQFFASVEPLTCLDVGCGVVSALNVVKHDFPDAQCVGIDPLMNEYRELYDLNPDILWRNGYLESLDVDDEAFSVVICSNALDHVENLERSLSEIRRVMRNDGLFLLTLDVFAREMERNVGHPYSFTPKGLRKQLAESGFAVKYWKLSRNKLGMMPYAEARLRQKLSRQATLPRQLRVVAASYVKQVLRKGSLGEVILVAEKV